MTATAKAHTFLRQARRDFPDKSATWRHLVVCNALNELGIRAQLFLRCMDVAPEDDGPDTALTVAAINLPDEPLIDEHRRRGEVSIFRGHLERNGMAHLGTEQHQPPTVVLGAGNPARAGCAWGARTGRSDGGPVEIPAAGATTGYRGSRNKETSFLIY